MSYANSLERDPLHENYLALYFALTAPEYINPDEAIGAVAYGISPYRLNKKMVMEAFDVFERKAEEENVCIKFYQEQEPQILEMARLFRKIDIQLSRKISKKEDDTACPQKKKRRKK